MSQEALAKACRDLPGREGSHVTREDISRYERGTRKPTPDQLERIINVLDKALELTREERCALVPTPARDAALAALAAMNGHDMNRRDLGKLTAAAAAQAVLARIDRGELSLHEATQELIHRYPTVTPAESFEAARAVLNRQFHALKTAAMTEGARRGLLIDAADTAALAGWAARIAGRPADAAASFALAGQLADQSDIAVVRGLVLISKANMHRPITGDGDALAGLELARAAEPLVGSRGPLAKYGVGLQAELLAARGPEHEHDSLRALDRALAVPDGDDRNAFFSVQGMLPAQWAASCHTQLGRADEALGHLEEAMAADGCSQSARGRRLTKCQIAHAHAVAGDPKATCHHAQLALDGSLATGYDLGVRRVRFARTKLPDGCDHLECVRELDARLATL
ncbi:MAG: helix-turn-helix transcriptional regulator, partial [Egibacteraceae bacterium]